MKNQNEARGRKTRGRVLVRRRHDHSQSCLSAPSAHVPVFHSAGLSNVEGKKIVCGGGGGDAFTVFSLCRPSPPLLSLPPSLAPLLLSSSPSTSPAPRRLRTEATPLAAFLRLCVSACVCVCARGSLCGVQA